MHYHEGVQAVQLLWFRYSVDYKTGLISLHLLSNICAGLSYKTLSSLWSAWRLHLTTLTSNLMLFIFSCIRTSSTAKWQRLYSANWQSLLLQKSCVLVLTDLSQSCSTIKCQIAVFVEQIYYPLWFWFPMLFSFHTSTLFLFAFTSFMFHKSNPLIYMHMPYMYLASPIHMVDVNPHHLTASTINTHYHILTYNAILC